MDWETFLQACINGLLMGGFYALMGMGQNVIFGVMKIVNFCHGEMLMVGMYLTYVLYTYLGIDPYLAVPLVALIMFALGALIQHTLITPSLGTKSFTNLLFLTVGLGLLLSNGALVLFGSEYRSIRTPYSRTYIPIGPVTMALPRLISFGVLIVVTIALFSFLKYTTVGKQIRAVSQNPVGAEVVGINVKRMKYAIGMTAGLFCGFGALVLTARTGAASASLVAGTEITILTGILVGGVSVLGGDGKIANCIAGVLIMGLLANGMQLAGLNTYYQYIAKGAIMLLVMWFDAFQIKRRAVAANKRKEEQVKPA